MNENMILTGWSKSEYVAGAAAALEALKGNADVAGVSMNQLAGVMAERGPRYATVYVLGVGLTMNIGAILAALKTLKAKGVKTVYLSSMSVAPEFAAEVCIEGADPSERGFDELVDRPVDSLVDVVAAYFRLSEADARFYRAYTASVNDRASAVGQYQTLVLAGGYMHRAHADDTVYVETIGALARRMKPAAWSSKLREAYEEYVYYGRRTLTGSSPAMALIRERVQQAAKYVRARVLIVGPSGTGKETVAQKIHFNSTRKRGHFIAFNCASVTPNLLEDRFFGHEKGAFTGADRQTKGLFERADHGTLFLDEIGEMPLEAQGILLRALEEGKIVRLGGTGEIDVDVRLVVATNRNLPKMVRDGTFRADLYQRISTIVIDMPPLAGRSEDIREIADSWWLDMCWTHLSAQQLDALCDYSYPGNVRELLNILDRARALEETDFVKLLAEHKRINRDLWEGTRNVGTVPKDVGSVPQNVGSVPKNVLAMEDRELVLADRQAARSELPDDLDVAIRQHVKSVFDKYNHNLTVTKNALGISINTLKKYLA